MVCMIVCCYVCYCSRALKVCVVGMQNIMYV